MLDNGKAEGVRKIKRFEKYCLKDIATVSQGFTFSRLYQGKKNLKWNYFKVADIGLNPNSKYLTNAINTINDITMEEIGALPFPKGSIVFPRVGAALFNNNKKILAQDSVVDDNVLVLTVTDTSKCWHEFLYYYLQGIPLAKWCNSGLVPVINTKTVLSQMVFLPTLPEQQKIATILSTQDKVIELKEKLLAQKQQQKKYLMQQLLTGRKPHKNDPRIEECEIGEVCKINPKQDKISESQVVFLGMADISETGSVVSQRLVDFSHIQSGFTAFRRGDILIAKITPCFENGKGAYTDNLLSEHGFGSTEFHVLRTNSKVNAKYIFYHTVSEKFRKKLEREMTGSAGQKRVPAISIQKYKIFLPSSNEQNFIIEILSTADHEIDLLQKSIDAEKQKKKALMQLLLTGKVRVKI